MAYLPPRLLQTSLSEVTPTDFWSDSIPGIWDGYPFRWQLTMSVIPQTHSSFDTPTPFQYDGNDVRVGDWVGDANGLVLQIVEIISKDSATVVCKAEDIDRYNTFNDPFVSGTGSIAAGNAFVFELGLDGAPILQGFPYGAFGNNVVDNIQSRFTFRNTKNEFIRVNQTNHGMSIGDFIKVDDDNEGRYELLSASDANLAVGIVTTINIPGADWFTFQPLGKLMENVTPELDGDYGDVFYVDPTAPGKVTNIRPSKNAKPVYIRLDSPNRAFLLNVSVDEDTSNKVFKVEATLNQVLFTMPEDAIEVQVMSINGIENTDFTFDETSKVLTFDPVATGYGVDETDEVFFIYLS